MWNLVFSIIAAILAYLTRGFVVSKIWAWFVVSTFDIIAINIPQAIGLSMLISFLTLQINQSNTENEYKFDAKFWTHYFIVYFVYPWMVFLGAWIVTLFL